MTNQVTLHANGIQVAVLGIKEGRVKVAVALLQDGVKLYVWHETVQVGDALTLQGVRAEMDATISLPYMIRGDNDRP